jgi:plastocyanin
VTFIKAVAGSAGLGVRHLKIDAASSYDYVCGIHPSMKGKLVIK